MAISEISNDAIVPAVQGENTAGGDGVVGTSNAGGTGVHGVSDSGMGVYGQSQSGRAIVGWSDTNYGVTGDSRTFPGVRGTSVEGRGVEGWSTSNVGVLGISETGDGVVGGGRRGVVGESETFQGVFGKSRDNSGVVGESSNMHAVFGITHSGFAGVYGTSDAGGTGVAAESPTGIGVHAKGGRLAGLFEGDVEVTGDIRLANADCAEDFDVAEAESIEPGTVMVVGDEGTLFQSEQAYDKRVAGVISGAGNYKPGIVLDKQQSKGDRKPIALLGKVFCKVDARYAQIEVGDLLTTSPTPGYAMKATDPVKAFGAVIGKALRPLREGDGLIPILIALQ